MISVPRPPGPVFGGRGWPAAVVQHASVVRLGHLLLPTSMQSFSSRFLPQASRSTPLVHSNRNMSTWSRLIRFQPSGPSTSSAGLIGEPVDTTQDVGLAMCNAQIVKAHVYSGSSVLAAGQKTGEVKEVGRLLSPLARGEVGTIRCIGLNVRLFPPMLRAPCLLPSLLFYSQDALLSVAFVTCPKQPPDLSLQLPRAEDGPKRPTQSFACNFCSGSLDLLTCSTSLTLLNASSISPKYPSSSTNPLQPSETLGRQRRSSRDIRSRTTVQTMRQNWWW